MKVLSAVWDGLRYSARNKTILVLFILLLSTTMTSMSFRSLMPAQVGLIFGGGPPELGILMSMIGVGALFGSLFVAGLTANVRRGVILLAATGLSAMAILVSSFVTIFFVAMVAMMVLGLGDAGRRSLNASLLMEQADEEHRGRVMGIYMLKLRINSDRSDTVRDFGGGDRHTSVVRGGGLHTGGFGHSDVGSDAANQAAVV